MPVCGFHSSNNEIKRISSLEVSPVSERIARCMHSMYQGSVKNHLLRGAQRIQCSGMPRERYHTHLVTD
jgi:hypothetical protein